MKKVIPFFVAVSILVIGCQGKNDKKPAESEEKTKPDVAVQTHNHLVHSLASAGCEAESWSPEVYSFYGDAETINKKLENADMDLSNRRLYIVSVESSDGAIVKLYEKSKKAGNVMIQQWQGKNASDFISQASANILTNKGINCVGEQTQAILTKMSPENLGDIPSPVSAQAAFSHDIKNMTGKYLRVTIFLMC